MIVYQLKKFSMKGVNKVILIGTLGRDPEVINTDGGVKICKFSIATQESWKDKNGEWQNETEWSNVVTFGKLADICEKILSKRDEVYVEGKKKTRSWENQQGEMRYSTDIVVSIVQKINKSDSNNSNQEQHNINQPMPEQTFDSDVDDDLPF